LKNFIARISPFLLLSPFLTGCFGTTPLHSASHAGDVAQVKTLLSQGVNVDVLDYYQQTPLIYASCPCRPEVIRVLLAAGADVRARCSKNGRTALDYASICGDSSQCDEARSLLISAQNKVDEMRGITEEQSIAEQRQLGDTEQKRPLSKAAPEAKVEPAVAQDDRQPAPQASAAALKTAAVSAADSPTYSIPPDENKFAVVIGIAKYRDIPEAEYADNDAKAVKRHLLALGYPEENIVTLLGDRATKSTLEDKLERWLPLNVNSKSTVFVYFSGHGAPDPATKDAYLLPWDGNPASLEATAFPLSRFYKDLNELPVKHVLIALDSCFSGAGGRSVLPKGGRPLVTQVVTHFPNDGKLVALTASGSDQISGTIEDQGHGAFTYYFLRGLNGDAPSDQGITVGTLYDYLSRNVSASAHRQEREQNPQLLSAHVDDRSIRVR